MVDPRQLESAIWSIVDGLGTDDDLAVVDTDARSSLVVLDDLIGDTESDLASVRTLPGDERDQVVADFTRILTALRRLAARFRPETVPTRGPGPDLHATPASPPVILEPEEPRLQASWSAGHVVVWAGGRGAAPEPEGALAERLAAMSGPPTGGLDHNGVALPHGVHTEARAISMKDALGWLVAVGGGLGGDGAGASLQWLARVAIEGVRLVARGAVVPSLRLAERSEGRSIDAAVRWVPALVDSSFIDTLAASMPVTVMIAGNGVAASAGSSSGNGSGSGVGTGNGSSAGGGRVSPTAVLVDMLGAVVEAIVTESTERMELPAPPPSANTPTDLADSVIARMDGSPFKIQAGLAPDFARRLDQWSHTVTSPARPKLVVQLDAPDSGGVWLASVHAPAGKGKLQPIDTALRGDASSRQLAAEWARVTRLFPALERGGARRRGYVALGQDEAWDFMTVTGPTLAAVGFDVRAPALSRRKATPSLRLYAESQADSVVGAHQLSNVAWSVLFDDVELTAADIARLAREARPLVKSRGRWVEVDRVDLDKAAAALAERASITQLTGAEILRQTIGLDRSGLSGGVVVHGSSWANDIVQRAGEATHELVTHPQGFAGELRTYQAEALAWIGFLDSAELGGCLALDMGLGKTPTVLAHLARTAGDGTALVIAPAAVVGNWAAEAARFAPGLRVVVHHGAARSTRHELEAEIAGADIVVTTYATAVRDVEALVTAKWRRIILDEAQAIKNPASETAQQLRRIPARSRIALTGTPIENGLGDLWAILDFTNPGLVGTRPTFIAQMSGDGEAALRALNGILLFRRTKTEPEVAAELPDKIDELDHCTMTAEQIGLYQAVLDDLVVSAAADEIVGEKKQGAILAAITALKQICNHPAAYRDDGLPLTGRSGKLTRLEEIVESVFAAGERVLIFTHFATWGRRLAAHLSQLTEIQIDCYDGSLARGVRDRLVTEFQTGTGPAAMVLSLKAGGTGLNLTAANHVVLYDRWWNPAVEDQARDRAWRIGQSRTVISHRLVCPGTVDERVEEVVAGKRHIAEVVLAKSSSIADLNADQLRLALGLRPEELLTEDDL
jgi:SNF2-related domain/SNF2 Helicase protein/Helicase conserved C-terminal domain